MTDGPHDSETGDAILDEFLADVSRIVGSPRSFAEAMAPPDEEAAAQMREAFDRAVDRKLAEDDDAPADGR